MNTAEEHTHLIREIRRLETTMAALASRIDRTLTALSITLNAHAATAERLHLVDGGAEGQTGDASQFLQSASDRYRRIVDALVEDADVIEIHNGSPTLPNIGSTSQTNPHNSSAAL